MITLHISPHIKDHLQLKADLDEMSLSRQVIESAEYSEPKLTEGKRTYEGLEAIREFAQQYRSFQDRWYECRCDKFEFDDD